MKDELSRTLIVTPTLGESPHLGEALEGVTTRSRSP